MKVNLLIDVKCESMTSGEFVIPAGTKVKVLKWDANGAGLLIKSKVPFDCWLWVHQGIVSKAV